MVIFSSRLRHALEALVFIADANRAGKRVQSQHLAEALGLNPRYLETTLQTLVRTHTLDGERGRGGGYRLQGPWERLTLAELAQTVDNAYARTRPESLGGTPIGDILESITQECIAHWATITLGDLVRRAMPAFDVAAQ